MKNKAKRKNELIDILNIISAPMYSGGEVLKIFYDVMKDERDVNKYHLGHGLYLLFDSSLENNTSRYSHLVREDNTRISETYFRLGGLSYGFKGKPYCQLIVYPEYPKGTWGLHCIIDKNGKIVLQSDSDFDSSLYYHDGVIASKKDKIYNLLTGEVIVTGDIKIKSTEFYFVEHNYDYENKYQLGVYKINKNTGEYEIFK